MVSSRTWTIGAVCVAAIGAGSLALSIFASPGPFYFVDAVNHYYLVQRYHGGGDPASLHAQLTDHRIVLSELRDVRKGSLYAVTAGIGTVIGSDWFAYGLTYLVVFGLAFGGSWARTIVRTAHRDGSRSRPGVRDERVLPVQPIRSWSMAGVHCDIGISIGARRADERGEVRPSIAEVDRNPHPRDGSCGVGSHLISVVFGTLFVIVAIVILIVSAPTPRRWPRRSNVLLAAGSIASAFAINAWFLVPQATYADRHSCRRRCPRSTAHN